MIAGNVARKIAKTAVDSRNEHGDDTVLTLNVQFQSTAVTVMMLLFYSLWQCVALAL